MATFRAAFGSMVDDTILQLSHRQEFHILRLIHISMITPERRIALVTLRGGDAQLTLNIMLKVCICCLPIYGSPD